MKAPSEIVFVTHWSRDLPTQRSFFVEVLGYELSHETADAIVLSGEAAHLVVLQRAYGATAHLDGCTHVGYRVEDLDLWVDHLSRRGAQILAQPAPVGDGQRSIVVEAPGGHSFALIGT